MRNHSRRTAPTYEVMGLRGGYVVVYTNGRRKEYLGKDKLWHAHPYHCEPFAERPDAEAAIVKEQEAR